MTTTLTQVHRTRLDTPTYLELQDEPLSELITSPADDREARYQAALKLVERIESNLRCSRRCLYWRISDKAQLTTVMEVVNAILANDLLLPKETEA